MVENGTSYETIRMKLKTVTRRCFSQDRLTLSLKAVCLLSGVIRGSYVPFLNTFFTSVGLTTTHAGIINGTRVLPPIVALLFLGGLIDHIGKRMTFLTILCLGAAFCLPVAPFIARAVCSTSNNQALLANTSTAVNITLEVRGVNSTLEGIVNGGAKEGTIPCTNTLFYVLLVLLLLASVFVVPLISYTDIIVVNAVESINNSHPDAVAAINKSCPDTVKAINNSHPDAVKAINKSHPYALEAINNSHLGEVEEIKNSHLDAVEEINNSHLDAVEAIKNSHLDVVKPINKSHPAKSGCNSHSVQSDLNSYKRVDLGVQKLFYAVGGSSATFLAGLWSDHFRYGGLSPYTAAFLIPLPCCLLLIPVTCFVISKINWERNNDDGCITRRNSELKPAGDTKRQKLLAMFRDFGLLSFMVTVLICGIAASVHWNFTALLIKDEITSSSTKISLVLVLSTASGLLGFFFSSPIIRLCGPMVAITISCLCHFLLLIIMSHTRSMWVMTAIQLLHFQSSSVAHVAMSKYIQCKVPKDINTTMHSITKVLFFGVGGFMANVAGGKLYDLIGGRLLFRAVAVLCGVWGLLMVVILILNRMVIHSRR